MHDFSSEGDISTMSVVCHMAWTNDHISSGSGVTALFVDMVLCVLTMPCCLKYAILEKAYVGFLKIHSLWRSVLHACQCFEIDSDSLCV